jgi:hypothetical protein
MKVKKEPSSRNDQILAASIFVLWSMGVIFFPSLRYGTITPIFPGVVFFYLFLHAVIFALALYLLVDLARNISRSTRTRTSNVFRAALYVYVLVSLVVSAGLTVNTLADKTVASLSVNTLTEKMIAALNLPALLSK